MESGLSKKKKKGAGIWNNSWVGGKARKMGEPEKGFFFFFGDLTQQGNLANLFCSLVMLQNQYSTFNLKTMVFT